MKKAASLLLLLLLLAPTALRAQVLRAGFCAGGGVGFLYDELYQTGPLPVGQAGLYLDLGSTQGITHERQNVLSFRTGLALALRGGTYRQEFPTLESERQGFYQGYYLQLPLLLNVQYALPTNLQLWHTHRLALRLGPVLGMGLFGTLFDEQQSALQPSPLVNFRHTYTGSDIFDHMRRFDIGALFSLGYQYNGLTLDLSVDLGALSLRPVEESLIYIDVEEGEPSPYPQEPHNPTGRSGQLRAVTLSLGYQLPMHRVRTNHSLVNPFTRH